MMLLIDIGRILKMAKRVGVSLGPGLGIYGIYGVYCTSLRRSESSAWSSSAAAMPAPGHVSFSPNIKKEGTLRDLV